MAVCESSDRRIRGQKAMQKTVVFISANTFGAGGANCQALKPSRAITRNLGVRTNNFELLMQKHEQAYSAREFGRKCASDNEM